MNLKEWLRSEGFLDHQQQQHASGPTHVFMDGGKAFVPADREAMFLNAYSACVLQRERLYVVERATAPTFRLFADLDFKAPEGAQWRDALDAAVRMVAGEAFRFFAVPDPSYATVCEAQPRRGAGGINKHGVHVVWQNIYATASTALAFRAALLRRLVSEVADHPFVNSWTDIVDASVYKSGGLRMIFSRKVTKCRCGGEDAACASCHGHGAYSDPLVYTPAYRYHAATGAVERIDDCTASMRKLVADCSIRSHGRAPSALGIPDPGAAAAAAAAAPQRRGGGRRRRLNVRRRRRGRRRSRHSAARRQRPRTSAPPRVPGRTRDAQGSAAVVLPVVQVHIPEKDAQRRRQEGGGPAHRRKHQLAQLPQPRRPRRPQQEPRVFRDHAHPHVPKVFLHLLDGPPPDQGALSRLQKPRVPCAAGGESGAVWQGCAAIGEGRQHARCRAGVERAPLQLAA